MTFDKDLIKPTTFTFALYLLLSVTLSIGLNIIWQQSFNIPTAEFEVVAEMASNSQFIQFGSHIIGLVSALTCAMIVSFKTSEKGASGALYFACLLVFYGVLSIVLHPEHTLLEQALKIVTPVPICLLGAWLAQRIYGNHRAITD